MKGPVTLYSYQARYGMRLQRLTVDGGFTCPNRDGALGTGGCTFCDNDAFHPGYTHGKSITGQLEAGVAFHGKRFRKADGYLAYFQPFSNTYADLDTLASRYEEALSFPGVRGLVVGTRPDCIDADKLQILKGTPMAAEYKERPGDFLRPGPQDYISLLADILERLRPDIAIGRIVSSVPPRFTDAPWGLLWQDGLMRELIGCLNGRKSFQGRLYSPTTATP